MIKVLEFGIVFNTSSKSQAGIEREERRKLCIVTNLYVSILPYPPSLRYHLDQQINTVPCLRHFASYSLYFSLNN